MTTYLTIDSSGVHGNNGYKTAEEDLSWSGNGYKKPFAAERTISALFGNIMENAISASAALPEEERYFNLTAELRHGNSLYVVSTNSFDGKVIKGNNGYRSTKHSGRGTGLISIAAVAEKYGGSAQFSNSEKEFYADVVMKI